MFKNAAALYVGLGFKVFPLAAGSKLPAIKGGHGFKDASDCADRIDKWADQFPDANIGIATGEPSGIVVIDIDPRNGGNASIAALAGKGFLFPAGTPEARTGNGGRHLYFVQPTGMGSSKNKLGCGIDVKSSGGYVVAAPSIIGPSESGPGGKYTWVVTPSAPLPRLPRWCLDRLLAKPKPLPRFEPRMTADGAARSLEGIARRLARATRGERNDVLNWSAFKAGELIRDGKVGTSIVVTRLSQAALAAGLPLPEVMRTIRSGIESAQRKGGHHA